RRRAARGGRLVRPDLLQRPRRHPPGDLRPHRRRHRARPQRSGPDLRVLLALVGPGGERIARRRARLLDRGEFSGRAIRAEMPEVAQKFLAQQPLVVLGAADEQGRMWATMLTGRPGFLRAEYGRTVTVEARPGPGDPLRDRLARPAPVRLLAIPPARPRRMRLHGHAVPTAHGLRVTHDQVYSN